MRAYRIMLTCVLLAATTYISAETSCSTFLLSGAGRVLVGHNLDDSIETPGMIVVNPRGLTKRGARYQDLFPFAPGKKSDPRLIWTARYGSITYNVFGKEFPDGGMNESGLYVGEMTLRGTKYPTGPYLTRLYHHAWVQYLLDNFSTVPEVIDALASVVPEGHCEWHFFVSDREGRAAVIEFLEGRTVVRTGEALPWKLLTNSSYVESLTLLSEFEGFGGSRMLKPAPDCRPDLRFVTAAGMIRDIQTGAAEPTVEQAFSVLQAMWCGVNRFSLVYDPVGMRMYFTTYKARNLRWVDFSSFDFTCAPSVPCLDIHRDVAGDVAGAFVPLTDEANRGLLRLYFQGIDAGFWGDLVWKPLMIKNLHAWQKMTVCGK